MATRGKMNARQRAARQRRKMILFAFEIIIILVMVAVLYLVMNKTSEGPKVTVFDTEKLAIPSQVQEMKEEGGTMHGYMNIALFGVDAQTDGQLFKGSRSDSTIIASINMDTGDIKLVSIYRDTYLNIGTDEYQKCNGAYSYGGAEQAVKMLNMNLDMDITNFVAVGYKGLSEVIDGLGGVYVDVDSEELKHINNYQVDVSNVLKCQYTPVTEPGYQLLNGVQATSYCRIRQTKGDDFQRAARQREVIQAIEDRAKEADQGAGWITLLWMAPEFQGKGLAVQLLGHAVCTYRAMGRQTLRLSCPPEFQRLRSFCLSHGFAPADGQPDTLEQYIGLEL